ncbi:MAG: PQQ-dependent sugar dehydrogenase [Bacteroidales bacterium]|nr:PQQ-dependent sugar dehydrogenase [Bacteroidales bacterium]
MKPLFFTNRIFLLLGVITLIGCNQKTIDEKLIPFAKDIDQPCSITNAGDDRLFVVGQKGYIYILDSAGNKQAEPFLDIHERVVYGGERGLLGLTFHPNFKENGYFYINYVGAEDSTHISRFSIKPNNGNAADASSEIKILSIKQPYSNHNGGCITFGPDGYLYIGMGDGGAAGDPENRSQNPNELLGKMLRIDVDKSVPYSIPADNPFVNDSNYKHEIWATGLRNPWRFSFDRLNGDLWIADVGQNKIEEIHLQVAESKGGENYGWRCFEGNDPFNQENCIKDVPFAFPVHTYAHGDECSITGGYIFRGSETSFYYGQYFFADYCSDRIWTLQLKDGKWQSIEFGRFKNNNFSTFGEDNKGRLYVAGLSSGKIFRINTSLLQTKD